MNINMKSKLILFTLLIHIPGFLSKPISTSMYLPNLMMMNIFKRFLSASVFIKLFLTSETSHKCYWGATYKLVETVKTKCVEKKKIIKRQVVNFETTKLWNHFYSVLLLNAHLTRSSQLLMYLIKSYLTYSRWIFYFTLKYVSERGCKCHFILTLNSSYMV